MSGRHPRKADTMDIRLTLLIALTAFALLFLSAKVLAIPKRVVSCAVLNALLGLSSLLLVNATGSITGLSLGANPVNAVVVGILGIPGLGLLFLAQWVL